MSAPPSSPPPRRAWHFSSQRVKRKTTLHGKRSGCRRHLSGRALLALGIHTVLGSSELLCNSLGEFLAYNTTCFSGWLLQFLEEESDGFGPDDLRLFRRVFSLFASLPSLASTAQWPLLTRRACLSLSTFTSSPCSLDTCHVPRTSYRLP